MKFSVLAVGLLAGGLASAASAQDVLRIATEGAYPPFNNVTADGELVGFDVEIAEALCAAMERECEIVAQDWDGIIPGLVNDKYDAIIASMSITEERKQAIDFSAPYYSNYLSVVGADGTTATLEKLGDVSIGAQRSTTGSQWAEDTYGNRADIRLYDTNPAAFSDLSSGRVETVVADFLPAAAWVKDNEGFGFVAEKIDIADQIGIGVRKGEDALRDDLNTAIEAIRADGTYQTISIKYFGIDIF
ncbi:transporter substrate-binding domain-containing protein [uncultured Tateyamaria sp.]|uniref:transporter substrate-binding domain-containing protein n=1 Tax=uncultured Tateyamaria sp. TaxID=455651 RepID=UPI00260C7FD5|nr:transporter substrate-binding domain-containing protein [uncultured Tateyamaria sp.]